MSRLTRNLRTVVASAFLLNSFAVSLAQTDSPPSETDRKSSRIRVLEKTLENGAKLTVIGYDDPLESDEASRASSRSMTEQGFKPVEGSAPQSFRPLYLVTTQGGAAGGIYDFSLKNSAGDDDVPLAKLVDVSQFKKEVTRSKKAKTALDIFGRFLSVPYKKTATGVVQAALDKRPHDERRAALGLTFLFQQAFDEKDKAGPYSELRKAFTREQMGEAGAALAIRHSDSNLLAKASAQLAPQASLSDVFERMSAMQTDNALRQTSSVIDFASQCGLTFETISSQAGLLSLDCAPASELRNCKLAKAKDLVRIRDEWKDECKDPKKRIPLQTLAMVDQKHFMPLADFNHPGKLRTLNLLRQIAHHFENAATDTAKITIPGAQTAATAFSAYYATKNWQADPLAPLNNYDRSAGQARLPMTSRSGELSLNPNDYLTESFEKSLESLKSLPKDQKERILQGLRSNNAEEALGAQRKTLELLSAAQTGVKGVTGGLENMYLEPRKRALENLSQLNAGLKVPQIAAKLAVAAPAASTASSEPPKSRKQKKSKDAAESENRPNHFGEIPNGPDRCGNPSPTAVVISVDGLGREQFEDAAARGLIPNLKAKFIDRGLKFDSFATNTVSTASWALAWSGTEPVTKGSSTQSRDPKRKNDNLLSISGDYKHVVIGARTDDGAKVGTRMVEEIHQLGGSFAFDSINAEERCFGKAVVDDGAELPRVGWKKSVTKSNLAELVSGAFNPAEMLDMASSEEVAQVIRKNPGRCSLVSVWFGAVDHAEHGGPNSASLAPAAIERAFTNLMKAAEADCRLKNATYFLVSDHGLAPSRRNKIQRADGSYGEYLPTEFNIGKYFLGDYPGSLSAKAFKVESSIPIEEQFTKGLLSTAIGMNHFVRRTTYSEGDGKIPLRIDSYGNNRASITFLAPPGGDITKRKSLYELTHFGQARQTEGAAQTDLLDGLLGFKLKNFGAINRDAKTRDALVASTDGGKPVGAVALALQGEEARKLVERVAPEAAGAKLRDPVLVRGKNGKAALILTRDDGPAPQYAYIVLSPGVKQDEPTKEIAASRSNPKDAATDDPLEFVGKIQEKPFWRSAREWAKEINPLTPDNRTQPLSIPGVAELLTLPPANAADKSNLATIPDLVLLPPIAGPFAHFNPHQNNLGNHGGYYLSEIMNSFYVSCPAARSGQRAADPILLSDFDQTLSGVLAGGERAHGELQPSLRESDHSAQIAEFCRTSDAAVTTSSGVKPSSDTASGQAPGAAINSPAQAPLQANELRP